MLGSGSSETHLRSSRRCPCFRRRFGRRVEQRDSLRRNRSKPPPSRDCHAFMERSLMERSLQLSAPIDCAGSITMPLPATATPTVGPASVPGAAAAARRAGGLPPAGCCRARPASRRMPVHRGRSAARNHLGRPFGPGKEQRARMRGHTQAAPNETRAQESTGVVLTEMLGWCGQGVLKWGCLVVWVGGVGRVALVALAAGPDAPHRA